MFKRKKERTDQEPIQQVDPFARILMQEFLEAESRYRLVTVIDEGVRTFYDHTYALILYCSINGTATAVKVRRYDDERIEDFVTEVGKCETLAELKALDEREKIYYD